MSNDFKATQHRFASYIRDPDAHRPPEDVDSRRMAMYRELFFNNIDGFLSGNFPVLRQILTDQQWLALTSDFFAKHRCQTPYFSEIAEEFLSYLQVERQEPGDYPFLLELAHYEWVEMALSIAQEAPLFADAAFIENIAEQILALSPVAWPLWYQYPVEVISPNFLPKMPPEQPTCLIVHRDAADDVHFLKTTSLTLRVLQCLQDRGPMLAMTCLQAMAEELPQLDPAMLSQYGLPMLRELAEKGIIIPATVV